MGEDQIQAKDRIVIVEAVIPESQVHDLVHTHAPGMASEGIFIREALFTIPRVISIPTPGVREGGDQQQRATLHSDTEGIGISMRVAVSINGL